MNAKVTADNELGTPEEDIEGIQAEPAAVDVKELTAAATRWKREFDAAEKEFRPIRERGRKVLKAYLDERGDTSSRYHLNLFWSNVQVIKSNVYAKPPKVVVTRLYNDQDDDVARVAATILERILNSGLEKDCSDFDIAAFHGVDDYLIPGLGQLWLDYKPYFEPITIPAEIDPMTGVEIAPAQESEQIADEDATSEYINWEDFRYSPCRTWEEARWVAKKACLTRHEAAKRFGEAVVKLLPTNKSGRAPKVKTSDNLTPAASPWAKIEIWEIWSKVDKKVYWFVENYEQCLDIRPDPLRLERFFPCPMPLVANATTSNFIPRPDYLFAQDQYTQIDELTTRITYLTKACKMVGVYDKNSTPLGRVFNEANENQMIPVDNWAAFAEKGGIKGQMDFIPIEVAAVVIEKLTGQREILIQKLYEVMGIADIMRGNSNPNETLGAQRIKAQFGSARLDFKQSEIDKWAAEAQQIKAQIICEHWQPETIIRRSNIEMTPDRDFAVQAVQMLKSEGLEGYRIKIEPESMATIDWAKEQEERSKAIQGLGVFMQSVTGLVQADQASMPYVLELMKWFLGGFSKGKEIESVMDKAIAQAQMPKPPEPPSPEEQAKAAKDKADGESKRAGAVNELADAMTKGFVMPVNAALMEMGLPAANPADVMAVKLMDKKDPTADGESGGPGAPAMSPSMGPGGPGPVPMPPGGMGVPPGPPIRGEVPPGAMQ